MSGGFANGWLRDLRVSLRAIRAMPGMSAVIVLSLAVGIGVNTTVFSWIQARLINPLPAVERGSRFHLLEARSETGTYPGLSWLEYQDLEKRLSKFSDVIAFRLAPFNVGAAEWSDRTYGVLVSGNYFSVLGLRPAAGRLFDPRDTEAPGGPPLIVVSYRFWQSRLNGAGDVAGKTLRVNDRPFTIVGVAPKGFAGTVMGLTFDLWAPATAVPLLLDGSRELESRGQRGYMAMGELAPGASRADAQHELDAVMSELAAAYPDSNKTIRGQILAQWQSPRGPQQSLTFALAMLQVIMLMVLAVVAGNTANLVLARASSRQQEVGVMLALGSGRWRVVRLLVTENVLLALIGALLGTAMAVWGTTAVRAVPFPTPQGLEVTFETSVDLVSLAFASLLGVLSGLLIGLPAGLHLAKTAPYVAMKGSTTSGRSTMREVFLVLEVALAIVVLVVAATLLKSFDDTRRSDPGFRREGVLLASYDLRGRNRAVSAEASSDFAVRLLERVRAMPGVESAAIGAVVPLDIHGAPSRRLTIEGRARPDGLPDSALTNTVTPGYFRTMEIPFVEGSDFVDLRDPAAPAQAIVNETFVRQYLPQGVVLGRRITSGSRTYVIAGVVRDSLYNAFGEDPTPFVYLSLRDLPSGQGELHVRTRPGDEMTPLNAIRGAIREIEPSVPLFNIRTLTAFVDANLVFQKIPARMFLVLGPLLLVLVAVGIYAVAAYAVSRRRREIGTRFALGATPGGVIRMLVMGTIRLVAYGMVAGGTVALLIGRGAPSLQQVGVLAGVALLFLSAAVTATWLSARQVSRIDPIAVLKEQ